MNRLPWDECLSLRVKRMASNNISELDDKSVDEINRAWHLVRWTLPWVSFVQYDSWDAIRHSENEHDPRQAWSRLL